MTTVRKRSYLRQTICQKIKRFKFEQLENVLLQTFPEVSWHSVKSKLVKCHEKFSPEGVARIVEKKLIEGKISEKELQSRLMRLKLLDISRHPDKKIWHAFVVEDSNAEASMDLVNTMFTNEMKRKLAYTSMHKTEISAITVNGIMYILIDIPTQKSCSSTYFAIFLRQRYFFCSKQNVSLTLLNSFIETMGYNRSRKMHLVGRDLISLMQLIRAKRQGALNAASITIKAPIYTDAPPTRNGDVNFCQDLNRKVYADKCFGEHPPKLQTLVAEGKSVIKDTRMASKIPREIVTKCEFSSHDLSSFLKKLIEQGIITTPVPNYITGFMLSGKNVLKLKE